MQGRIWLTVILATATYLSLSRPHVPSPLPEISQGHTVLDVCCGSGDLAFRLADKVGRARAARATALYKAPTLATSPDAHSTPRFAHPPPPLAPL